jgi:radical SAM superfamily enzyme YgiQ (UPF0313 family)
MLRERKFDLTYHITGMRVNTVDMDILKALKDLGVWHIQFGFESGSQKILNIMEKRTTVEENIRVVEMTRTAGINTIPFIIIGFPGETEGTVYETIDFLRQADLLSSRFRPNLPMAMPGTPLYEYAKLKGYVTDEDEYLEAVSDLEAAELTRENYFINYTDSPDEVVMKWMALFQDESDKSGGGRSVKGVLGKVSAKLKEKGLRGTVSLAMKKLSARAESRRMAKIYSSGKMPDERKTPVLSEIPPEGLSLREVNRRLREKITVQTGNR